MGIKLLLLALVTVGALGSCPAAGGSSPCRDCPDSPYLFEGVCLNECPEGFISRKVQNYYQCQQCDMTKLQIPNAQKNECVCAPQHFSSFNEQCKACHYTCLTCSGITDQECLTCNSPGFETFRERNSFGRCVCEKGYYESIENPTLKCQSCHPDCSTCTGSQDTDCTICKEGRAFNEFGLCACPATFQSDDQGNCVCLHPYSIRDGRCLMDANCGPNEQPITLIIEFQKVTGSKKSLEKKNANGNSSGNNGNGNNFISAATGCECIPGFHRIKGQCQQCGENFVYNEKKGKCECIPGARRFKDQCIVCLPGQFFNPRTGECQCNKNEQKTESGSCIRCPAKSFYEDGQCQCIFNYYKSYNGKCRKCTKKSDNPACQQIHTEFDQPKKLEKLDIA